MSFYITYINFVGKPQKSISYPTIVTYKEG